MAIAAVPAYLPANQFATASPGMRFSYFLGIWTARQDQESILQKKSTAKSKEAMQLQQDLSNKGVDAVIGDWVARKKLPDLWQKNEAAAHDAWQGILKLNPDDRATMIALVERQTALAAPLEASGNLLRLETRSVAPFATGLGNEHPLENGFAFINPYGLPYLAGSGVKGVLRQAARELASGDWGDTHGWDSAPRHALQRGKTAIPLSMLDVLFGREGENGDTEHVRGALTFWDVFPQLKGHRLQVEVMTPHQTHYYQRDETPHESGSPNPINFLTVPPGSDFVFHVGCNRPFLARLAPDLDRDHAWQPLLRAAFAHAFAWLGFGAKTAVGYGAMKDARPAGGQAAAAGGSVFAAAPETQTWTGAEVNLNPGSGELTATAQGRIARLTGPEAQRLRERLPEPAKSRLAKQRKLKNCEVEVRPVGNAWQLVDLRAIA